MQKSDELPSLSSLRSTRTFPFQPGGRTLRARESFWERVHGVLLAREIHASLHVHMAYKGITVNRGSLFECRWFVSLSHVWVTSASVRAASQNSLWWLENRPGGIFTEVNKMFLCKFVLAHVYFCICSLGDTVCSLQNSEDNFTRLCFAIILVKWFSICTNTTTKRFVGDLLTKHL